MGCIRSLISQAVLVGMSFTSLSALATAGDDNWVSHGRDSAEQRFSPLTQINQDNVDKLGLAWSLDLPGENALQATPLVVDGVIYFNGGFDKVYAVEAVSGRTLWTYDPQSTRQDPVAASRLFGVKRGVAYLNGKVYAATRSGRMIALDAKTGALAWSTPFILPGSNATSTGAPRAFKDKIIIGNAGAETGARGYVTALDSASGKVLWRFFIVPGDPAKGFEDEAMEEAAKTWSGEWWTHGGGGTPWNGLTYDEELNQFYIGTGNGAPWDCQVRSKEGDDNLYLSSVVALDADTGKYKWHYQYNPRECWDWKATSEMIVADLKIEGKDRKVLMQAPSNGFLYVIDRLDGKVISAEKLGKANWADRIDLETGRPVERPGIRYENGPVTIYPSNGGAHSWQASSFNPDTGLLYIPYAQLGMTFKRSEIATAMSEMDPGKVRQRYGVEVMPYVDPSDPLDGKGALLAWDPVKQKALWKVVYPNLITSGTVTTRGKLVFQGTIGGHLYAYDALSGKQLWDFNAKLGIISPPITYSVDGRQYVSVLVGPGGSAGEGGFPGANQGWKFGLQPRRLLTFTLDGKAELPDTPPPQYEAKPLDNPDVVLDPKKVEEGMVVYHTTCTMCHGVEVVAVGGAPDLRESPMALHLKTFRAVAIDGALESRGMPRHDLSDAQLESIYQYIRYAAREALKPAAKE